MDRTLSVDKMNDTTILMWRTLASRAFECDGPVFDTDWNAHLDECQPYKQMRPPTPFEKQLGHGLGACHMLAIDELIRTGQLEQSQIGADTASDPRVLAICDDLLPFSNAVDALKQFVGGLPQFVERLPHWINAANGFQALMNRAFVAVNREPVAVKPWHLFADYEWEELFGTAFYLRNQRRYDFTGVTIPVLPTPTPSTSHLSAALPTTRYSGLRSRDAASSNQPPNSKRQCLDSRRAVRFDVETDPMIQTMQQMMQSNAKQLEQLTSTMQQFAARAAPLLAANNSRPRPTRNAAESPTARRSDAADSTAPPAGSAAAAASENKENEVQGPDGRSTWQNAFFEGRFSDSARARSLNPFSSGARTTTAVTPATLSQMSMAAGGDHTMRDLSRFAGNDVAEDEVH